LKLNCVKMASKLNPGPSIRAWAQTAWSTLALLGVLCGPICVAHAAEDTAWLWAEPQGALHTSARLEQVPEPYRSAYAAERVGRSPQALEQLAQGTSLEADRAKWQLKVLKARTELMMATRAWAQVQGDDANLRGNPILRMIPQGAAPIEAHAEQTKKALARFRAAYVALTQALPQEARAAGISPTWLQ
jgi:hypothetical protein